MPAWLIGPLASRLMMAGLIALVGAVGVGWWSYSAETSRLTRERDAALERVGRLTGENDKLVLAVETQNGAFVTYQIRANSLLAASSAALVAANAAGQVLAGVNDTLRSLVLPTAPDAACTAADALILEFVR